MPATCALIDTLKRLQATTASAADRELSIVATAALNILADIDAERLTQSDIAYLADLIAEISKDGLPELLEHLRRDAAQHPVCGALARHLDLPAAS